MEPEGPLPCLYESTIGPYLIPLPPPYFSEIHVNIIFLFMPRFIN
jgi:hypothetical protein